MREVELLSRSLSNPDGTVIARFRLEGKRVLVEGDEKMVKAFRNAGIFFSGKHFSLDDGEDFLKALVGKNMQSTLRTTRIVS